MKYALGFLDNVVNAAEYAAQQLPDDAELAALRSDALAIRARIATAYAVECVNAAPRTVNVAPLRIASGE